MHSRLIELGVFLYLLVLQGCSVSYYNLHNMRKGLELMEDKRTCFQTFAIIMKSGYFLRTQGYKEGDKSEKLELRKDYIEYTRNVFSKLGCHRGSVIKKSKKAALKIQIRRQLYLSALPQEWLTGLSFGIIPSWSTRPKRFIYGFENRVTGDTNTYWVNRKSYNHLILFPLSWTSYFTLDEEEQYKEALMNFMKSSPNPIRRINP